MGYYVFFYDEDGQFAKNYFSADSPDEAARKAMDDPRVELGSKIYVCLCSSTVSYTIKKVPIKTL